MLKRPGTVTNQKKLRREIMLERQTRERASEEEHEADDKPQPSQTTSQQPEPETEPASPREYQEGFWN